MPEEPTNLHDAVAEPPVLRERDGEVAHPWRLTLLTFMMLYLFVVAINMMGAGLQIAAKDEQANAWIHSLFSFAENPFVGLSVGLLVTSIVQSSSFTASIVVLCVAHGEMTLVQAIPVIIGANMGTGITALLVSMGHVRRRREFRLAFAGAAAHCWFKTLTACVILPAELGFGLLSRSAMYVGPLAWPHTSGRLRAREF